MLAGSQSLRALHALKLGPAHGCLVRRQTTQAICNDKQTLMNFRACLVLAFMDHKIIWLLPAHADSPMRQPQVFIVSGTARTTPQEVGWGTRDREQPSPFHTNPCMCTDIQLNSGMQKPINKHLLFKHLGTKREVNLLSQIGFQVYQKWLPKWLFTC